MHLDPTPQPILSAHFGDQTTLELFYRLQFARHLAITPSIQILGDPALNPEEDEITVISLRLRLTL